jgi:hypothetical protein
MAEAENQHKAEIRNLSSRINTLTKEKELLADTSAKEKAQIEEKHESQVAAMALLGQHLVLLSSCQPDRHMTSRLHDRVVSPDHEVFLRYPAPFLLPPALSRPWLVPSRFPSAVDNFYQCLPALLLDKPLSSCPESMSAKTAGGRPSTRIASHRGRV